MKIIIISLVFISLLGISQAFAMSSLTEGSNSLEYTELYGRSAAVTLDIEFGQDEIQQLLYRTIIHPQIDNISLTFYGDEITLSEPELRVVGDGRHFRISSISDGVLIYGHYNIESDNYKINVLLSTDEGFIKFPVTMKIII